MLAYIAMFWDETNPIAIERMRRFRDRIALLLHQHRPTFDGRGFFLADISECDRDDTIIPITGPTASVGAIYGTLFSKTRNGGNGARVHKIDPDTTRRLNETGGRSLARSYWGKYVAFFREGDTICVVSDPTSSLPCYYMRIDGVTLVFSHLEKCTFIDRSALTINYDFIAELMVYDKVQNGQTGINEVKELLGGNCLHIAPDRTTISPIWDPREIANDQVSISADEAAEQLKETTLASVSSWCAQYSSLTVSLSGGLDSSIVLACLAEGQTSQRLNAVHQVVSSRDPTEQRFAALAADYIGVPLTKVIVESDIQLPGVDGHPLSARPHRKFVSQDPIALLGGDVCPPGDGLVTGQGGDHLFFHTRTSLGFVDYLLRTGVDRGALQALLNASRLSGKSILDVIREATPYVLGRKPLNPMLEYIPTRRTGITSHIAENMVVGRDFPEWCLSPSGLEPAKFQQICGLFHLFQIRETIDQTAGREFVHPLISQPLIELCLRIPVETLCLGGTSRGLARRAFAGLIPDEIRARQTKGGASQHFIDFISSNRSKIKNALLSGELIKAGIVREREIELFFDQDRFRLQASGRMLLIYYTIEAWLSSWTQHLRTARMVA